MFDNVYEIKQDFNPLLKEPNIKPVLISIKNTQDNDPVERVHQVILNMLVSKYLVNKFFDHIYTWGETLEYIAWAIRDSYHLNIMVSPFQGVVGRYMLFNLASAVYWRVVTASNQRQVDMDNDRENSSRVTHYCAMGDQVYVEITGIYRKLDYKKQGPYIITEVFTNGTV